MSDNNICIIWKLNMKDSPPLGCKYHMWWWDLERERSRKEMWENVSIHSKILALAIANSNNFVDQPTQNRSVITRTRSLDGRAGTRDLHARNTGCSLNIVFFLKMLWFFCCSAGVWPAIVHTHTDTEGKQSPEYF